MVAIFPKLCLWRRSLCSNLGGIGPEKLYRATLTIAFKELKIAQIAQVNELFQLLNLVQYGHGFYELSRILMRKNVNNDASKDSPFHT